MKFLIMMFQRIIGHIIILLRLPPLNYLMAMTETFLNQIEPISRAEVAELITRAFNLEFNGTETEFNDLTTDHWAYNSIQTLASHGMIQGYDDKTFKSENSTTRAEFTKILYNAMN